VDRAKYGTFLVQRLSGELTIKYGKGFDQRNLYYMKQFYTKFPNVNALRSELSWTHYRLLLKVENESDRKFYMDETVEGNWSTFEMK
jgi:hypothetical protein